MSYKWIGEYWFDLGGKVDDGGPIGHFFEVLQLRSKWGHFLDADHDGADRLIGVLPIQ